MQLFQLARPVTFQPVTPSGTAEIECEAAA